MHKKIALQDYEININSKLTLKFSNNKTRFTQIFDTAIHYLETIPQDTTLALSILLKLIETIEKTDNHSEFKTIKNNALQTIMWMSNFKNHSQATLFLGKYFFKKSIYLANHFLSKLEQTEKDVTSRQYTEATLLLGDLQYNLKDYNKALEYYQKAADKGTFRLAYFKLGYLFYHKIKTHNHTEIAFSWFYKAAQKEHPESQANIGFAYQTGIGTSKNYASALIWNYKAAAQGQKEAQNNLFTLFHNNCTNLLTTLGFTKTTVMNISLETLQHTFQDLKQLSNETISSKEISQLVLSNELKIELQKQINQPTTLTDIINYQHKNKVLLLFIYIIQKAPKFNTTIIFDYLKHNFLSSQEHIKELQEALTELLQENKNLFLNQSKEMHELIITALKKSKQSTSRENLYLFIFFNLYHNPNTKTYYSSEKFRNQLSENGLTTTSKKEKWLIIQIISLILFNQKQNLFSHEQNSPIIDIFNHENIRKLFIQTGLNTTNIDTLSKILSSVIDITNQSYLSNHYNTVEMEKLIVHIGKQQLTENCKENLVRALDNIIFGTSEKTCAFTTNEIRDLLLNIGNSTENEAIIYYLCRTINDLTYYENTLFQIQETRNLIEKIENNTRSLSIHKNLKLMKLSIFPNEYKTPTYL